MHKESNLTKVAIIGGGPTALLMFKRLLSSQQKNFSVAIFEKKQLLGAGMPYSRDGARDEHITNVSGNEIPDLSSSVEAWISTEHRDTLDRFHLDAKHFNDYKVLPRLLFGRYLSDQFQLLLKQASMMGIDVDVHYGSKVIDIIDDPKHRMTTVVCNNGQFQYDRVIICSGHHWPQNREGKIKNYFDSPYPPEKIALRTNHPVAIRGSSLTAIDAVRTLARSNGTFSKDENGKIGYTLNPGSENFSMTMHSRNGLLPAVRFHLEDPHLSKGSVLEQSEVSRVRDEHEGFLPLDYVYKRNFLEPLQKTDPDFYASIAQLSMEEFVETMMLHRESVPAFELLAQELQEAAQSIKQRTSVNWKEMLAVLSFAMNYPAKHFSAEDMERLKKTLMPLISVVIAFAPQGSVNEMMALHEAGLLDIISVGEENTIEVLGDQGIIYRYKNDQGAEIAKEFPLFIDAIGQPHLQKDDLPFPSLLANATVSTALLKFKDQQLAAKRSQEGDESVVKSIDGLFYSKVPGIAINDNFQVLDVYGAANQRIYMLAVPYIGGYNPDFSGLDFGEAASERVLNAIFN
ncbi:FAD/NAD(P)-binding protein [Pedobacter aquatilis]|uniref:FAD/NAD(P)-binding protein n=1 Tax=Pedobacter aquatilis TaxID=351343 RepID=UPI00293197F0|nr:FAD/NAD(P)-binding protein [Pedobacter aquatilis]